jgi:hypothetical protein
MDASCRLNETSHDGSQANLYRASRNCDFCFAPEGHFIVASLDFYGLLGDTVSIAECARCLLSSRSINFPTCRFTFQAAVYINKYHLPISFATYVCSRRPIR